MKKMRCGSALLLALLVWLPVAVAAPHADAQLDALLARTAAYRTGYTRTSLIEVERLVTRSTQSPAERRKMERGLLDLLESDAATTDAKRFACGQLSRIGSDRSVAALARLLGDPDLAHRARVALERIPGKASGRALRKALGRLEGELRMGAINSIGERRDARAEKALIAIACKTGHEDAGATAVAALAALGKIGEEHGLSSRTLRIVKRIQGRASDSLRSQAARTLLDCCVGLLANGKTKRAWEICEELHETPLTSHLRIAVLTRMAVLDAEAALPYILEALTDENAALRRPARGFVSTLAGGEEMSQRLIETMASLPAEERPLFLQALAERSDARVLDLLVESLGDAALPMRLAGLEGLARIGTADHVDMFLLRLEAKDGTEREAARAGLAKLRGTGVDETILRAVGGASESAQCVLVKTLADRMATATVPDLLGLASSGPPAVRRASFESLVVLADADAHEAILTILLDEKDEKARLAGEKAAAASARSILPPEAQTHAVLGLLGQEESGSRQASLVRVLGRIGGGTALEPIRERILAADLDVQDAAIRTLADWPTDAPAPDLLVASEKAETATLRILALRGYVRMIGMRVDRPLEQRLAMYQEAIARASRKEEKQMIFSGVAAARNFEVVPVLESFLDDTDLRNDAIAALLGLAAEIGQQRPSAFESALRKIVEIAPDEETRETAKTYLAYVESTTK